MIALGPSKCYSPVSVIAPRHLILANPWCEPRAPQALVLAGPLPWRGWRAAMQHDDTQALPENMPLEQLEVSPLGELRRQAELIAATADAALTRYTALRRCRRGTAPEPIEAAHTTWRAQYQLRD